MTMFNSQLYFIVKLSQATDKLPAVDKSYYISAKGTEQLNFYLAVGLKLLNKNNSRWFYIDQQCQFWQL